MRAVNMTKKKYLQPVCRKKSIKSPDWDTYFMDIVELFPGAVPASGGLSERD